MSVKHFKLIALIAMIAAFVAAPIIWFGRSKPVAVLVESVAYGSVQSTVSNTRAGTVKACRRAGISPSIGGQIISMPVRKGDLVKTGQVLMTLWNQDRLAQLELARDEAKVNQANARQACIKAEVASKEAERQQRLQRKQLTSDELVDKRVGDARALQAACNAAKAANEVSSARIEVAQSNLDQTRLTAPFPGTLAEVNGEVGEYVTPSPVGIPTPPAIDLIDTSCLFVSAPIDEVDAPQIRVGLPANISLDAFNKRVFKGKVRRVAPYVLELEKQARTVEVEVDFLCQEECKGLLPGYSADIEVILQEQENTLRVPTEAVIEGNRMLIFSEGAPLVERKIETGLSNWAWTEVTKGLQQGEEIVLSVERDGVAGGVPAVREKQAGGR